MNTLNLNEEQLKELEEFAMLHFSLKQLAILVGIELELLQQEMEQDESLVRLAIQRGRLLSEAKLRKTTLDLAENGSSPALTAALKLILDRKMEDI